MVLLVGLFVLLSIAAVTELALGGERSFPTTSAQETTGTNSAGESSTSSFLVRNVNDGDTITLDNGDRVRFVQIDAPELLGECNGRNAAGVLRQLLPEGTHVSLVRDRRLDDRDKCGRLLRFVLKGSLNFNLALVDIGAASASFFHGDRGTYAAELLSAAKRARAAGRVAWGACRAELDPVLSFQTYKR